MPDMFNELKKIVSESSATARAKANPKTPDQAVIPVAVAAPIAAIAAPPVEMKPEGKAAPVFKAAKVVADKSDPTIIIGIGAVAGNLDLDGEELSVKAMTDMAHQFCEAKSGRTFKLNHETECSATLLESWLGSPIYKLQDGSLRVVKALETIPDGASFAGISNEEMSHWFIAVRPNDQSLVKKASEGTFGGFSWAGWVNKETVTE